MNRMNRSSFDFLDEDDKMQFINNYCTLIAKRKHHNFCYELYQSGTFYIELQMYVHKTSSTRYFCFDDISYLEPYLSSIDVSI